MDVLSCIDQCFIPDSMLEQLPAPSWVGKTKVGGIDLNKPRMRWVVEAVIALSPSADGRPLLAAAQGLRASRGAQNPTSLDRHYETIRTSMQAVFSGTRDGRLNIDNYFFKLRP